jgi:hypothetical protein
MARSTFHYVIYIRTTPEKLWSALTDDVEFMKQYWFGVRCESEWRPGSSWKMVHSDGSVSDAGEIVEPNRWRPFQLATVPNRRVNTEREAIRSRDFDLGPGPLGAEDGDALQATFGSLKRDALARCPLARLAQRNGGRQLVPGSEQGLDR